MKYAHHHDAISNNAVAENVFRPQYLKDDLAIGALLSDRKSEFGTGFHYPCLGENFSRDDGGEPRMAFLQESGETIEIGECNRRPFELH